MHLLTGLYIYIKTQIVGQLLALASKTSGLEYCWPGPRNPLALASNMLFSNPSLL